MTFSIDSRLYAIDEKVMIYLNVSRAPNPASLTEAAVDFKMLVVTIAELWAGIDISKPSSPV